MKIIWTIVCTGLLALMFYFNSTLYELYYSEISDILYNENIYPVAATIATVAAFLGAVIFYYVINTTSWLVWWRWLLVGLGASILAALGTLWWASSALEAASQVYLLGDFVPFGLFQFLYTLVAFWLASMAIRWWSSRCSETPYPY